MQLAARVRQHGQDVELRFLFSVFVFGVLVSMVRIGFFPGRLHLSLNDLRRISFTHGAFQSQLIG